MRTLKSLGGVMILASLAFSCQVKENIESPEQKTENLQTISLTVEDNNWADEVRSSYEPGVGIKMSGAEPLSIFYVEDDGSVIGRDIKIAKPLTNSPGWKATGESGNYTLTLPAPDGMVKAYAFVPYNMSCEILEKNSGNKDVLVTLPPVQFPEANSFDPHFDYLVSKPFEIGPETTSATVQSFKRLFAPLRLQITGIPDGEKIYAVNIWMTQSVNKDNFNCLTGKFRVSLSENYDDVNASLMSYSYGGNGVSALYPEGLEKQGDSWPVWYMINPMTIAASSSLDLIVTVTTAEKTYYRIIRLPNKETQFLADKFNELNVDMTKKTSFQRNSFIQFFNEAPGLVAGNNTLVSADGVSRVWKASGTKLYWDSEERNGNADMPGGLYMYDNRQLVLPEVEGKSLTKLTLYTHPDNQSYSLNSAQTITVRKDTVKKIPMYYGYIMSSSSGNSGLFVMGGHYDLNYPELTGTNLLGSKFKNVVSAIVIETNDSAPMTEGLVEEVVVSSCKINYWPFTTPTTDEVKTSSGSAELGGQRVTFTETEKYGGYTFYAYASGGIYRNSRSGLGLKANDGDYIEFPGKEGYKISRIRATVGYGNSVGKHMITDADGNPVEGGDAVTDLNTSSIGEVLTWDLSGTAENAPYRITFTSETSVQCQFRNFAVCYTPVE